MKAKKINEKIAIIGMGCRYPGGANNPYLFWENIKAGKDSIIETPHTRYNTDFFYSSYKEKPGKIISKWGGYIDGFDEFDPEFFGITPYEATHMDPQQRKLLEVTWEALEDAGLKPGELAGQPVGVFMGAFTLDYKVLQFGALSFNNLVGHTAIGSMMTMISNRISYIYDFRGPAVSLDTACSSSLVAVHLACESIRNGDSSMALAGGVLLHCAPQYTISESKGGFLSPTGWSHVFDDSANGYVRAEGVGIIVLKKLKDALKDGDPVHAVILASGSNQDGKTEGITVPNPAAQINLMKKVYARAGVQPGNIQYIEAHGTGTPVGDPLEANALSEVLKIGRNGNSKCYIGSVKTNIGHTEAAAGIAGLIKTVMSLKHKIIPGHLHLNKLNPKIDITDCPYEIPRELTPWPDHTGPARAGVNSFGFGGTNAHVILEEAPEQPEIGMNIDNQLTDLYQKILPLTAKDEEVLKKMTENYMQAINLPLNEKFFNDIGYTLANKKEHLEQRLTFIYDSRKDLLNKMEVFLAGEANASIVKNSCVPDDQKKIAWVFTGMGPQWWGMGRELYNRETVFRNMIDNCDKEIFSLTNWSLKKLLLEASEEESAMSETWLAQPANFAIQVALAALWRSYGIQPAAIIGHSTGEVAACYEAGIYSFTDAVRIIVYRSSLQATLKGTGGMAAVSIMEEKAQELIKQYGNKLSIAAVNSADSITIAGDETALDKIIERMEDENIFCRKLQVNIPYHSPYMENIKADLLQNLKNLRPLKASVPYYSTCTGRIISNEILDADYWWRNVREKVSFHEAMSCMIDDGYRYFLEIGPHPVLKNSIKECLAEKGVAGKCFASIRRKEKEEEHFLITLAEFFTHGFIIDWQKFYPYGKFISLPAYPWKKERYWIEPKSVENMRVTRKIHPLVDRSIVWSDSGYESSLDTERNPYLKDHCIQENVIFPAAGFIEIILSLLEYSLGEGCYSLEFLEIKKALFLSENKTKDVQFLLQREASSFKIITYNIDETEPVELHISCKVRSIQDVIFRRTPLNINALNIMQDKNLSQAACYDFLFAHGYHYGPSFRGIKEAWVNEKEVLARISAPGGLSLNDYYFHPSLLDACFQAFILTDYLNENNEETNNGIKIPVFIDSIRLKKSPPRDFWAYAMLLHKTDDEVYGNIFLYDDGGQLIGEIIQFTARWTDKGNRSPAPANIDRWIYQLNWVEKEAAAFADKNKGMAISAAPSPVAQKGWIIFADNQGCARALCKMFESRGDYSILVYPGQEFLITDEKSAVTIRPEYEEDIVLLHELLFCNRGIKLEGIIHLWNIDFSGLENIVSDDLHAVRRLGSYSLLIIARVLNKLMTDARLWIITRGAHVLNASTDKINPLAAPAWGVGRVLWYQELTNNKGKMIDLDPHQPLPGDWDQQVDFIANELKNNDADCELLMRSGKRYVLRLKKAEGLVKKLPLWFRNDCSYLVTGAFGSLGRILCRMLIVHGARRLLLMSRSVIPDRSAWNTLEEGSPSQENVRFIKELELLGADIVCISANLTDEECFCDALRKIRNLNFPPIRGIFHSAGQVKDSLVQDMDINTFNSVYDSKVMSCYLLHKYFAKVPLDHFIIFSSIASIVPAIGQTNYAAGNAFLDAMAYHRQSQGLPALSIDWGAWAVGMIKDLNLIEHYKRDRGMSSIPPEVGADIMNYIFGQNSAQLIVTADVDWARFLAWYPVFIPTLEDLIHVENEEVAGEKFIDVFSTIEEDKRPLFVRDCFREIIANVLQMKKDKIDADQSLSKLGLDSILALDLRNKIINDLGCTVTVVTLLSGQTIDEISIQICEKLCNTFENESSAVIEREYEINTDKNEYPLSYGQQGIWFIKLLNPDSFAYNIGGAIKLPFKMDIALMKQAMSDFCLRHPCLRSNFYIKDGKPLQKVVPDVNLDFIYFDMINLEWEKVYARIIEEYRKPFDLEKDALIRFRIFRTEADGFIIMNTVFHIISDAISTFIAIEEILKLYHAYEKGVPAGLPALETSYFDFINTQNKFLATKRASTIYDFWLNYLPSEIPILNLPLDKPRPLVMTNNGASYSFSISAQLTDRIRNVAHDTGTTVFMILLSAYYILVHRYTSQEDIIIGSPVSGRTDEKFSKIYGYFVNPLPLYVSVKGNPVYDDFLKQIQKVVLNCIDNQEYPFGLLVQKLGLQHDPSRSAVFQIMFILLVHRVQNEIEEKYGYPIEYIELPEEEGQFDITLSAYEDMYEGIFHIVMKYNTDLFFESTIKRMAGHYLNILEEITQDQSKRLSEYNILTPDEKTTLLNLWSGKEKMQSALKTVHSLITLEAEKNPGAPAVCVPSPHGKSSETLSYGELNQEANRLALYLREKGVTRNTVVAVCMHKTKEMIISLLGILKSGGAFLCIDPNYPQDRIAYMLGLADAGIIITKSEFANHFSEEINVICIDRLLKADHDSGIVSIQDVNQLSDTAYIIFTSGSSGKPKGIRVTHANLASVYKGWELEYRLKSSVFSHLQMASPYFDVFCGDFVRALCSGGKLILCNYEILLNIPRLYSVMLEEKADFAEFVPVIIRNLFNYMETARLRMDFMKVVIVGSDTWTINEYKKLKSYCSEETLVYNSYGLSETTIDSTFFTGDLSCYESGIAVPIGKPFPGNSVYILDKEMTPVPIGIPGEIYIGGGGIASEYIKNNDLTNKHFVNRELNGEKRFFRTGDWGKWDSTGNIHFLGRIDNQVKIRGFRIELKEIEKNIESIANIKQAVVVQRQNPKQEPVLCAYYVTGNSESVDNKEFENHLGRKLPAYMIPSYYQQIDKFPISANGKIDIDALPMPLPASSRKEKNYSEPTNKIEKRLGKIWSNLLGIEKVGLNHDFFRLGGNSLKLIELLIALQTEFSIQLTVNQLFRVSTLSGMANLVEELLSSKNEKDDPYYIFNSSAYKKIFCFPPAGGYSIIYRSLAEEMQDYSLISFDYIVEDNKLEKYADIIEQFMENEPINLFGYSLGGNLAYEVAKVLEARGRDVRSVIIMDSYRIIQSFEFNESDEAIFREELSKHLLKHTGSAVVHEHLFNKAKEYIRFCQKNLNTGKLQASVYVIVEEGSMAGRYYIEKGESWKYSSNIATEIFNGNGKHIDMLDPGFLGENAKIIRKILTNFSTENKYGK